MRNTIDMPGELGGANWGGEAADPMTGMLYVRSHNAPTVHILSARPRAQSIAGETSEERGRFVYAQACLPCHGEPEADGIRSMDRTAMIRLRDLGSERVAAVIRQGQNQMPPFSETVLPHTNLQSLLTYLANPAAVVGRGHSAGDAESHEISAADQLRFFSPYGTLNASNGLPAINPPWADLTAYDLNKGTIEWQVTLGVVTSLAARGITNTGTYHPTRNGLVVTAGGLIFIGTWSDRMVRAFDKETGEVLWEHKLESNPEGIPAVYEVNGRQYVAFCTRVGRVFDNIGADSIAWEKGDPNAQGYHVFALPNQADLDIAPGQTQMFREEEVHGRSGWVLENDRIRVGLVRNGGHIAEVRLVAEDPKLAINPMFIPSGRGYAGHMVCFPHYGPASESERRNGMRGHGEAGGVEWAMTSARPRRRPSVPRHAGSAGTCASATASTARAAMRAT
jgi:mono/diheme cytochrome c family protein